jgi:hypothetical protein
MIELKDWISTKHFPDKPWLLLGKGPTFGRRNEFDLTKYNTLALNHVVREVKVDVAHLIDIDVIEACGETIITNCDWLIMPRQPNVKFFPSEYLNLSDWLQIIPMLQKVENTARLVTYNFAQEESPEHSPEHNADPWTIVARYFSSEAALGILGRMGVRKIHTLGIDGGTKYSKSFEDLASSTLLTSGQPTFDLQFEQLAKIARQFNFEIEPLVEPEKIAAEKGAPETAQTSSGGTNRSTPEIDTGKRSVYVEGMTLEEEYPTLSNARSLVDEQLEIEKRRLGSAPISLAEKIQLLEEDLRRYRAALQETHHLLTKVSKDLVIGSERLTWARNEVKEYRVQNSKLTDDLHKVVQSGSWKLGRALTKPADLLNVAKRGINPENTL